MARKLLAEHGGTIECASAAGVGTTFMVRLPAAERKRLTDEIGEPAASAAG
jgi:signal transduction histidine kinase